MLSPSPLYHLQSAARRQASTGIGRTALSAPPLPQVPHFAATRSGRAKCLPQVAFRDDRLHCFLPVSAADGRPRARRLSSLCGSLGRIVCRVHVGKRKWPHEIDLDDCACLGPCVVVHVGRRDAEAPGPQRHTFGFIELVAHS